jgi:uncharacterized protein
MTSDTAFKIVDFALAQSNNGHPVQINFFGGEPFLCLDLMREVADYTLQCAVQKQLDVTLGVTTNGTLLGDDAMAFLIDYGVDLCISLDGPANIHDHQRVYPDGSGTFKDVMGNLNKALDRNRFKTLVGEVASVLAETRVDRLDDYIHVMGTVNMLADDPVPI